MEHRRFSQTMAFEWQTTFVVSHKMSWCVLLTAINNYNKSLKKLQDLFFKTETKTKTFIFVLETPRDQDPVVSRTSVLKAMMWKVNLSLNLIYVMCSSTDRVQLSTGPLAYFVNIHGVFFVIWIADKQANKVKT